MRLGYVGLGKMGFNMVLRLLEKGHDVDAFDHDGKAVAEIAKKGAIARGSIQELVSSLDKPRLIRLMVPHQAVDPVLREMIPLLE